MNSEINNIVHSLSESLSGSPWYGKSVYTLLDEVHPTMAYKKPLETGHSLIELLYHMNTWAGFTLKRLEKDQDMDMPSFEALDWRLIDPKVHTWSEAIKEYKEINGSIISFLEGKDDSLLNEKVDFRQYDFRVLLWGLVQHNIYHAGQIAYVKKLLDGVTD